LERDLARVELWEDSLRRSRQRRELAAARGPELPGKTLSVTALVALAGIPATGVAAAKVFGGGGGGATATAAAQHRPAVERPDPRLAATDVPAKPASSHATTHTVAAVKPAKQRDLGVTGLQRELGVPVDGDFGAKTEKALKRWQRAHGLAVDGVAGPQVRAALDLGDGNVMKRPAKLRRAHRAHHSHHTTTAVRAVAARHVSGGGVRALQQALGLGPDGVFGPATQKALKRWQRAHGLTPDGVAGPATRAKLGLGPGKVLKRRGGGRARRHSGGGSSTGGGSSSVVQRVIAAANSIATKPYVYGGGHGSFNAPGYDCSGSVSYALHGGGLLSSPLDSTGLMGYGAPGPGRHITIYANSGHAYMTIDGRRFDTSARSQTGSRWSGSGRSGGGYVVRHPVGY
jgi:peptidoglycan hydrolase-like protein with peptidoglycan-binding domain